MAQVKYVAAGFKTDVGLLLSDFIQAKSLDFSVFAEIWKAKNFSLVYMGRTSEFELTEFTQEIFGLSARFLTTETSINARVGAVFLLYALFRNQILDPPLRIRMVKEQFQVMANIRRALDGHRSLCYVIDYLCEFGMDWVACPTFMGPVYHEKRGKTHGNNLYNELSPTAMADLKTDLTDMADSKVLQGLSDLSAEYVKFKVKTSVIAVDSGFTENACRRFNKFASRLKDLVKDAPPELPVCYRRPRKNFKRIGARRTRLKQKAMGQQISTDEDSDRGDSTYVPRRPVPTKKRGAKSGKIVNPRGEGQGKSLKAEVLGKFNKRKKPKSFKYDANYWAPNDSETQVAAEISYWYKKDTISDADVSESEDVDSPKPVEPADPPDDSESLSKDSADTGYWYKKETVSYSDDSERAVKHSPKPVVPADAPNDSEILSKDSADTGYRYKKETVSDADDSKSEVKDSSPKPVVPADTVKSEEVEH